MRGIVIKTEPTTEIIERLITVLVYAYGDEPHHSILLEWVNELLDRVVFEWEVEEAYDILVCDCRSEAMAEADELLNEIRSKPKALAERFANPWEKVKSIVVTDLYGTLLITYN